MNKHRITCKNIAHSYMINSKQPVHWHRLESCPSVRVCLRETAFIHCSCTSFCCSWNHQKGRHRLLVTRCKCRGVNVSALRNFLLNFELPFKFFVTGVRVAPAYLVSFRCRNPKRRAITRECGIN